MAASDAHTPAPAGPPGDPFEDYRSRGGMRCPHCRHIATRRSSMEVTPLIWDVYYRCSHEGCGHTWKAQLSYTHGLSPSAVPDPDFSDLPMRPMARDDVVKPEPPPPDDPRQPRFFD
jgi:hypothetical protein